MIAFYILGIIDLQDMFPVIMEACKRNKDCWIVFFDCVLQKRRLKDYTKTEIESLFRSSIGHHKMPRIDFYGQDDKLKFEKAYRTYSPETVFVQEVVPKHQIWYPTFKDSKVVCFGFWSEAKHITRDVDVVVLKSPEYAKYYDSRAKYFGNLRCENLKYLSADIDKSKKCFIPETYLRLTKMSSIQLKREITFYDQLFQWLKSNDYTIVWKKREKGYPKLNWASPLDYTSIQPDIVIDRDLFLPSSLFQYGYYSDLCLLINDCFVYFDLIDINLNTNILTTSNVRHHKMNEFFNSDFTKNRTHDMTSVPWNNLSNVLQIGQTNTFDVDDVASNILNWVSP
jgi:hypothetical protein